MKMKNLLFATMLATVFASCSDDNDSNNGVIEEAGNATLTITVKDQTNPASKSALRSLELREEEEVAVDNTTTINNLTIALFKEDGGIFVASSDKNVDKDDDKNSSNEVTISGIRPGSYKIMAFANMKGLTGASFEGKTATDMAGQAVAMLPISGDGFTTLDDSNIPMSSILTAAVEVKKGDNYYGYSEKFKAPEGATEIEKGKPLMLYRNVARVDLASVTLNAAKNTKLNLVSGTATLKVKNVLIANAHNTAKLGDATDYTKAPWGSISSYTKGDVIYSGVNSVKEGQVENSTQAGYYINAKEDLTVTQDISKTSEDGVAVAVGVKSSFYVLENVPMGDAAAIELAATKLVVEASYKLVGGKDKDGGDFAYAETLGYYPVKVGIDALEAAPNNGVHRNYVYTIKMTIAGIGSPNFNPGKDEKANLFVQVGVEEWAAIEQDVVIE